MTLGGRRVPVQRPRMRAADGSGELPVPAYELFSSTEILGRIGARCWPDLGHDWVGGCSIYLRQRHADK